MLNSETGDSLIQKTKMTATNYAVAVSLFSVAYAIFEVYVWPRVQPESVSDLLTLPSNAFRPSNYIMKRYVRPSRWLSILLCGWGLFTIGFSGVQNYATVVVLRFFIGMLVSQPKTSIH